LKGIYKSQKEFFHRAYQNEVTPWPKIEPTREVNEFLLWIMRENGPGRMLDLGCGEGRHSLLFQENGFNVVGVDYEPSALIKAKKRSQAASIGRFGSPSFVAGDLFSLPFKKNIFDVVLDYGCLHHIKKNDFELYFGILLELLMPRGYFILSCFSTAFKHYAGEKRKRDWLVHKGHYDRFFRKSDFVPLFGSHFDILRIIEEKNGLSAFYHVLMRRR